VPDIGMEELGKKVESTQKMGVEQVWQTSFATPIPKILVHCIIDSLMNLTPKGTSTPKWGDGFGKMQFGNWCIMN
jgi:hypothetical protein